MTRPKECWGLAGKLVSSWQRHQAVRIGEAAVVSRLLHTISPQEPDTVRVLTNADAGQVFYKRLKPGEIVHLDLFHEVIEIQPREIASWLTSTVMAYQADWSIIHGTNQLPKELTHILDFIDVQTGAGGGRLTGKLNYGQRQSLRQTHMNHIHLTVLLPDRFAVLAIYLANSLERYLLQHGIDIRRINRIVTEQISDGLQPGSDEYSAYTDSMLLEYQQQAPSSGMDSSIPNLSLSSERATEKLDRLSMQSNASAAHRVQTGRLSAETDSSYVARLNNSNMIGSAGTLDDREGRLLRSKMRYSFDRNLKPSVWQGNEHFGPITLNRTSGPLGHKVDAYQRGSPLGQLAVVETMTAFMQRRLETPNGQSTIEAGDLHVQQNRNHSPCNICLLIDASASMKGKRLQAATTLAKHLVAATRDKVSVLTFQESEVRLTVPFTRKIQELNAGLEMIRPYGLTPLAAGLAYARDYLRQTKARNPLLVLISDGIPTVPMRSSDPIGDAIEEAKQLRDAAIHFCCIGLEPNQSVLGEVTAAARGKLHVVKELDSDALVQIVVKARESINV